MPTLNLQVGDSANDGSTIDGVSLDTASQSIGNLNPFGANAFARFTSVLVPQGQVLTSATLVWTAQVTQSSTTVAIKVHCADADNQAAPTTEAEHDAIVRTTAFTTYDGNGATGWTADTEYSVDVTTAVQEVVDRAGWASGNALVVLADNNASSANAFRQPYDYAESTTKAPKLVIIYPSPGGSSTGGKGKGGSGKPPGGTNPPGKLKTFGVGRWRLGQSKVW